MLGAVEVDVDPDARADAVRATAGGGAVLLERRAQAIAPLPETPSSALPAGVSLPLGGGLRRETFAVTGWRPAAPNARRPVNSWTTCISDQIEAQFGQVAAPQVRRQDSERLRQTGP